jgi:hypothetical protein
MSIAQITLTVEESKRLIAKAISIHPKVKKTLDQGSILFKGGTTVSEISEIIVGKRLRLCGITTGRGTVINMGLEDSSPHVALYKQGEFRNIDESFLDDVLKLTDKDLIICGANAIDSYGNAAMMTGSLGGGDTPYAFSTWYGEGVPVIIPVGLEKLIPNNINDIIKRTGRRKKVYSTGMAVGLMPVIGEIVTEVEAINLLTGLKAIPIAAGGMGIGKGSITFDVEGEKTKLKDLMALILKIKEEVSDLKENYIECEPICVHCKEHLGCIYKRMVRG